MEYESGELFNISSQDSFFNNVFRIRMFSSFEFLLNSTKYLVSFCFLFLQLSNSNTWAKWSGKPGSIQYPSEFGMTVIILSMHVDEKVEILVGGIILKLNLKHLIRFLNSFNWLLWERRSMLKYPVIIIYFFYDCLVQLERYWVL